MIAHDKFVHIYQVEFIKKNIYILNTNSQKDSRSGCRSAQLVDQVSPVQGLCPRCSGFDSWPGSFCCVSLPPSLCFLSKSSAVLSIKPKVQKNSSFKKKVLQKLYILCGNVWMFAHQGQCSQPIGRLCFVFKSGPLCNFTWWGALSSGTGINKKKKTDPASFLSLHLIEETFTFNNYNKMSI